MRVIFMGTGDFAIPSLEILNKDGYEIVAVITQPDRAKDRKGQLIEGALKKVALELGLKVLQFEKIKQHIDEIKELKPDIMITASYGQILSKEILEIAPVYNVHASLLPKYRGSSPIQWAIINGDKITGVTIMRTEIGLDTGDILSQSKLEIKDSENYGELFDRLKTEGAILLSQTLKNMEKGLIVPEKQDNQLATKCSLITSETAHIDWNKSCTEIYNLIRGLYPTPEAYTVIEDKIIKILSAQPLYEPSIGVGVINISDKKLLIGCGQGNISVLLLKPSGKKQMDTKDFINGNRGLNGKICK